MHLLRREGCLQMRELRWWGRGRSWVSHMAESSHSIPACRGSERKRRSLLLILRWQPWPTFHKDRLMQTWWYAYNRGARRALPEVSLAMRRQQGVCMVGTNWQDVCSQLCPGWLNSISSDDADAAWEGGCSRVLWGCQDHLKPKGTQLHFKDVS